MTGTPDAPHSVDLDRVLHDLDRLDVARLSDLGVDRIRVDEHALVTSDLNDTDPHGNSDSLPRSWTGAGPIPARRLACKTTPLTRTRQRSQRHRARPRRDLT